MTDNSKLQSPGERYGERLRTPLSAEAIQNNLITHELTALHNSLAALRESGSLPRAAALLLGARRRYIAGEGKSAAYAQLLNVDLSATLSNVFLIDGHGLQPLTVLMDVRASDVLVLFSLRRYRSETILLGKEFKRAGGRVITVTDTTDAPLAKHADEVIRVDTNSASYADSPTAVAATCHLLSTITAASAKGAKRRLTVRDEISKNLHLYTTDEEL